MILNTITKIGKKGIVKKANPFKTGNKNQCWW